MYIEKINGPEDVKKLTVDEMTVMAGEMREAPVSYTHLDVYKRQI